MRGERLREFVFGYNDGAVTTLAIIIVLTTAGLENFVVILGALANVFGVGTVFALGDYISVKSQMSFMRAFRFSKRMSRHEKEEVKDIVARFDHPGKIAAIAFVSFIAAGNLALLPFLFLSGIVALASSVMLVFISVFLVGLLRSRYTHRGALGSGLEILLITGLAMAAAYSVGYALSLIGAVII